MNADGAGAAQLTSHAGADSLPTWSPDGTQIAFRSDKDSPLGGNNVEVYVVAVAGGKPVRLTDSEGFDGLPDWEPAPPPVLDESLYLPLVIR